MPLAEIQTALARLFTDADARESFGREPGAAGRALGLDDSDARALASLAPHALEDFAASLNAKRALDARKLLALTAQAFGPAFGPRLRAVLDGSPRGAAADALALIASLSNDGAVSAPWAVDVARYEAAFIEMGRRRWGFLVRRFAYPAPVIAVALGRGETFAAIAPRAALAFWARAPGGRLMHRYWPIGRVRIAPHSRNG
jgi:hypothetical protein